MRGIYDPTGRQRDLLARLEPLMQRFTEHAAAHDRESTFSFDNMAALREAGYLAASVPLEYGGGGYGLADIVLSQSLLAHADASTALSVGMHLMTCATEAERELWPADARVKVFDDVVTRGVLINNISAEPELGSPKGGGLPATTIEGLSVDGHKLYCTAAPALGWMVVYGRIGSGGETDQVGRALVAGDAPGVRIDETWDALGMRATASHDVYFEGAVAECLLTQRGLREPEAATPMAWFPLLIGACSLGIAESALTSATEFACGRRPTGYARAISSIQAVREQLARAELELASARQFLIATALAWDARETSRRAGMAADLAAAKLCSTNAAVSVVDASMRVVGGAALARGCVLERAYRDVRSGLVNPPIDSRGLEAIAARLLG